MDKRKRETIASLTNGNQALRRKIDEQEKEIERLSKKIEVFRRKNACLEKSNAKYRIRVAKKVKKINPEDKKDLLFNVISRAISALEGEDANIARDEAYKILIKIISKIGV